nr:VOC family protein [Luteolibacter luteus]
MISKITPCLWFDHQAEEAANFYVSIFKNSRITEISRYSEVGQEQHGRPAGSVMVVEFELEGHRFTGLNGGPHFTLSPAISFQIDCADQAEVDYFWEKLGEGGPVEAQQCGWVQDKFGLSWQVVPSILRDLTKDLSDPRCKRAFGAMMQMKKLDIAELKKAYEG